MLRLSDSVTVVNALTFAAGVMKSAEVMDVLWEELGLPHGAELQRGAWEAFMMQFIRRQVRRLRPRALLA
jgi:hypothetical protein